MAGGIDGGPADEVLAAGDGKAELRFDRVENAERLGHDFGPDTVAGEDRDAVTA